LVLSRADDGEADAVGLRLAANGIPYLRLDADALLKAVSISLHEDTGEADAFFRSAGGELRDSRVVWLRHFDPTAVAASGDDPVAQLFVRSEWEVLIRSLCCAGTAKWVNHPEVLHELDRLSQLRLAHRVGLNVPKTMVSNDPDRIASFVSRNPGGVIVKVLGNHFLEPTPGRLRGVFPQLIFDLDREALASAAAAPSVYQEYVAHAAEVRATVVGRDVVAVQVDKSDPADIWGHPEQVSISRHTLPREVKEKLRAYVKLGGIEFGAFDLLVSEDGAYTFLEVNLVGDWRWLERQRNDLDITGLVTSRIMELAGGGGQ
jgi:hypothetical protein